MSPNDASAATGSRRSWRLTVLGFALALAGAGLDRAGLLTGPERRSLDLRATILPRPDRPMTDEIVHVDIDDGAIDRIGRWPWSRATLADAIDELGRAGAATIALDIVFSDRTKVEDEDGDGDRGATASAGDRRFAEALSHTRAVVPVVLPEQAVFDEAWQRDDGPAELDRLMRTLAADIRRDDSEVADLAALTGVRRRRFLARPLQYKKAAAWRALGPAAPPDWPAFERIMTPGRSGLAGDYPERSVLETVWTQHHAWELLSAKLAQSGGTPGRGGTHRDLAPLPRIAAAASAVGFVNFVVTRHPDGRVRELPILRAAPGGAAVQFGVSAALAHRGLGPADLSFDGDQLRAGAVRLPLRAGQLWIAWPTSKTDPRWVGLLDPGTTRGGTAGHVSIREVVELARARRTRAALRRDLAAVTKLVFARAQIDWDEGDLLGAEAQGLAADEADFTIAEATPDDAAADAASRDPVRDHLHNCRTWRELTTAIDDAHARIDATSAALRDAVGGKLVFIGSTATAAADFCATAIGPSTPGVVVHAAIADMVLTGRCLRFVPPWVAFSLVLLPALACAGFAARASAVVSAIGAAVLLVAYAGVAAGLFARLDVAVPVVAPLVVSGVVWIAVTALEAWRSQRDRQRITRQFKSRVSGDLVDFLVANPGAVTVDGVEREVTVLFGDLAGFTSMSESLGGPRTVTMLNRYLARLAEALVANGAYVNKFLGDGFMAFWSAFTPDPEQARKARASITACREAMDALNAESRERGLPELDLRIGIATGRVVVGDCGAPPSMHDYTVIGDAVNLAARLESANKQFGTTNLMDGRTRELLGNNDRFVRPVGRISVVGQEAAVDIHEVALPGASEAMLALCRRVVESFTAARLDEAAATLDTLECAFGATPWSRRYRRAIDEVDDREAFDGTLRLSEK